jgi:hypothetical protein
MKQIFTPDDLLRYIYKEMDAEEEKALEHQLFTDTLLANEFSDLLDGIALLGKAEVNPSNSLLEDLRQKLHLNKEEHSM